MVNSIYPPELHLNKDNTSDTEAPFLDLHFSISNSFVSSQIYDKRDDIDFDIYTASKVKHHLNIFLEKTVKLSKYEFNLVTCSERDKVVTIYSNF